MKNPPNLLILWTDQQRGDCLGVMNSALHTPNLDELAKCSTVFSNAITTQPVCTPARGAIMTGLWPHQHGTWKNNSILPNNLQCIPEYLKDKGAFKSGHIGKWHLGIELFPQHGFDHWEGSEDDYQQWFPEGYDKRIKSAYHHWLLEKGYTASEFGGFDRFVCCQFPEAHSKPAWTAERTIEFLENADPDEPWILDVNTLEPHHPNTSCRNNQYDPNEMPLPPACLESPPEGAPEVAHVRAQKMSETGVDGMIYPDEQSRREAMARYYGLVSLVDTQYGRILDCLKRTGQFENTLIIFTSDHGEMLNQYGMWGKCVQYRGAVHVPLMVKLPGQRAMRTYDGPVSHIDILPTILDYYDIDLPSRCSGRSLLPACRGEDLPAQDAFCEWEISGDAPILDPQVGIAPRIAAARLWHQDNPRPRPQQASARTILTADGWRFSIYSSGERELYHLPTDPAEGSNVAWDPELRETVCELEQRLRAWQVETDDFLELPTLALAEKGDDN